jgi:hypothetical protein
MIMPATSNEMYDALKELVPSMPKRGVVAVNLKLRPNSLPRMTIVLEPGLEEGARIVQQFDLVPRVQA